MYHSASPGSSRTGSSLNNALPRRSPADIEAVICQQFPDAGALDVRQKLLRTVFVFGRIEDTSLIDSRILVRSDHNVPPPLFHLLETTPAIMPRCQYQPRPRLRMTRLAKYSRPERISLLLGHRCLLSAWQKRLPDRKGHGVDWQWRLSSRPDRELSLSRNLNRSWNPWEPKLRFCLISGDHATAVSTRRRAAPLHFVCPRGCLFVDHHPALRHKQNPDQQQSFLASTLVLTANPSRTRQTDRTTAGALCSRRMRIKIDFAFSAEPSPGVRFLHREEDH